MSRFNDPMGAAPTAYEPKKPNAAQIEAIGRALPAGKHLLTMDQQQAWFGKLVFSDQVSWDGNAFVSGDKRITPAQIARMP